MFINITKIFQKNVTKLKMFYKKFTTKSKENNMSTMLGSDISKPIITTFKMFFLNHTQTKNTICIYITFTLI